MDVSKLSVKESLLAFSFTSLIFLTLLPFNLESESAVENPEWGQPRFNYSYNPSNESLTLTVTTNPITARRGSILFNSKSRNESLLLEAENESKRTNVWVQPSLLDAMTGKTKLSSTLGSLGENGISDLPLQIGEKVVIKKDYTDTDGEPGIENEETIKIYSAKYGKNPELYAYVSVSNNTVRVFRFGPSSDREWKPCNIERRDLCETVQAYNFQ